MGAHTLDPGGLVIGLFIRLRGWWRIFWGTCPLCNSDAPCVDTCALCEGFRGYPAGVLIVGFTRTRTSVPRSAATSPDVSTFCGASPV